MLLVCHYRMCLYWAVRSVSICYYCIALYNYLIYYLIVSRQAIAKPLIKQKIKMDKNTLKQFKIIQVVVLALHSLVVKFWHRSLDFTIMLYQFSILIRYIQILFVNMVYALQLLGRQQIQNIYLDKNNRQVILEMPMMLKKSAKMPLKILITLQKKQKHLNVLYLLGSYLD